jgi:hypothetical protein
VPTANPKTDGQRDDHGNQSAKGEEENEQSYGYAA